MKLVVLGIGADGRSGLGPDDQARLQEADVVFGGARHLAMLDPIPGQQRHEWPRPLREGLRDWPSRFHGLTVVALASGDPLLHGIGSTLVDVLGSDRVELSPAVSSVSLARAEMRWSSHDTVVLRDHRHLARHLTPGRQILVLSADESIPAQVAAILRRNGFGDSRLAILGDLGAAEEIRIDAHASDFDSPTVPRLNIIAVKVSGARGFGIGIGLPDEAFEHDGQLTRRDLRACALARLAPNPGELLWDIGAGAGSIGIEWMRSDPSCHTLAIEADPARAVRIRSNAEALGVPDLRIVVGRAPDVLTGLEAPQAIFIGGGASRAGLIERCWEALPPDGRLVVHGVTAQTEARLVELHAQHGGELMRHSVEHAEPLGGFTGWSPRRAVTQWAVIR